MKPQRIITRALEALALAMVLLLMALIAGLGQIAQAQDYGYNEGYLQDGDPEFWSDIQNQPNMILYRSYPDNRGLVTQEPEFWSDIQNPPQMIIYPGRGRYSGH